MFALSIKSALSFSLALCSLVLVASVAAFSQKAIDWNMNAASLRGNNSQRFEFVCDPDGTASTRLWGSGIYTDDSSICTAAAHAGVIRVQKGGPVTIEIRPGASSYAATSRNGITSQSYGAWSGSFVIVGTVSEVAGPPEINWNSSADSLRGKNGEKFSYRCPPNGVAGRLWGDSVYTDDSSICTAAVHDGVISLRDGGTVVIQIMEGMNAYAGSTKRGVTSKSYGSWHGSFVFVKY